MILVLGKARSCRAPDLGCKGGESPGWFDVLPEKLCTKCDTWAGVLLWQSCQSPVARSCSLLNHPNTFHRGMFKLNAKSDADSLLYSLSHFECDNHTVYMLTQWRLPLPATSTVKSSLFTCAHSSPLSLAARLCRCHTNCSRNNKIGWTFFGQTSSYALRRIRFSSITRLKIGDTVLLGVSCPQGIASWQLLSPGH